MGNIDDVLEVAEAKFKEAIPGGLYATAEKTLLEVFKAGFLRGVTYGLDKAQKVYSDECP